jgi:hypothetical protein
MALRGGLVHVGHQCRPRGEMHGPQLRYTIGVREAQPPLGRQSITGSLGLEPEVT